MLVAIVSLPRSGTTTVFNALTGGAVRVASYGSAGSKPNIGVAKVADHRLDRLEELVRPDRKVPAEATFLDIPVPEGGGESLGTSGERLNHLQRADVLLVVARAFEDGSVHHVNETIDAFRDAETSTLELALADLQILDRRLARLEDSFKGAKPAERDALTTEQSVLSVLKAGLEDGAAIRDQELSGQDSSLLEGFQLLTAKPLVVVANVGEDQTAETAALQAQLSQAFDGPKVRAGTICGSLEMELVQMEPDEEAEFRDSFGVGETAVARIVQLCSEAADEITFFTTASSEVRAWPLTRGATAQRAAGRVHTDMERGFVRAEVVSYNDMLESGSKGEARKRGLLRQEGKTYAVQDGDVIDFLFNV